MKDIKLTLQSLFPDLKIESLSILGAGNDSNAVLVNNETVFKIPKHKKASDNLIREKKVLDIIQDKITLPIPKIDYVSLLPNGFTVIGYSKLSGEILTKDLFDTLPEKQKYTVAKEIAKFLNELHSIKIYDSELLINKKQKIELDYQTFMDNYSKYLNSKQIEKAKNFFEKIINDNDLYKYKPTLVHNDFSAGNILFDKDTGKISAIIDFGDVAITDRDNDFLCLLENSDEEYGRDFGIKVLQYYGCNNQEIDLAIKKADINDEFWSYEEMLLSKEYNDNDMFENGLNNI